MFYEVEAKCGHVGKSHFVIKSFPVIAESGEEAARIVRHKPRVKHHHKDAIRSVSPIGEQRYRALLYVHDTDPYFRCKNIQEQRELCLELLLIDEDIYEPEYKQENTILKKVYYGKEQLRHPKRYYRNYMNEDDVA